MYYFCTIQCLLFVPKISLIILSTKRLKPLLYYQCQYLSKKFVKIYPPYFYYFYCRKSTLLHFCSSSDCVCRQREESELQRLEEEKAAEEKRRQQKAEKASLDESLKMKRDAQMKQEQEEHEYDRKILEQLLVQYKAEQQEQSQRKVSDWSGLSDYCRRDWHLVAKLSHLGGTAVRASNFWPRDHGFDSRSVRYQAPRSTQPSIPPG